MTYPRTTPYKSNARHGSPGVLLATATRDRLASQMTTSTVLGPTIFCPEHEPEIANAPTNTPRLLAQRVRHLCHTIGHVDPTQQHDELQEARHLLSKGACWGSSDGEGYHDEHVDEAWDKGTGRGDSRCSYDIVALRPCSQLHRCLQRTISKQQPRT